MCVYMEWAGWSVFFFFRGLDIDVCKRCGETVDGAMQGVGCGDILLLGGVYCSSRHSKARLRVKDMVWSMCSEVYAVRTQVKWWQEQTRGVFWERDGLIAFTTTTRSTRLSLSWKIFG